MLDVYGLSLEVCVLDDYDVKNWLDVLRCVEESLEKNKNFSSKLSLISIDCEKVHSMQN